MTRDEWRRIERIFHAVVEAPLEERLRRLDEEAPPGDAVRAEVERLIKTDEEKADDDSLETPFLGEGFAPPPLESVQRFNPRLTGDRIGPWRLIRIIASGGMGMVYLAERDDGEYQQQVAIKVINTTLPEPVSIERFRRERQTLANLDHPSIARLIDGGTTEAGLPYLAMEFIEGAPIDEYCRRRRLPLRSRLELFLDVCDAVQFAHQHFVVHRDLKPGNVLVTADGAVKLLDFGLAKAIHEDAAARKTLTLADRQAALTPDYASPEQLQGGRITTASDVYSLGVLLYELIASRRPYHISSRSMLELERVICHLEPRPPSEAIRELEAAEATLSADAVDEDDGAIEDEIIRRDPKTWRRRLEGDLDTIVLMALRKAPDRRYQTVGQLAEDIRRTLDGRPIMARRNSFWYRAGRVIWRWRGWVAAASIISSLLISGFVSSTILARRSARDRDRAEAAERVAANEAANARAVSDFLIELFEVADPYKQAGEEITAREIVSRGAARLPDAVDEHPQWRGILLNTMAQVYVNLGFYREAHDLLEPAIEVQRHTGSARVDEFAESLNILGQANVELGDYDEARRTFVELLDLRRKGNFAPTILAEAQAALASVENLLGEHEKAHDRYHEALRLYGDSADEHDTARAAVWSGLGEISYARGEYDEAERCMRRSIELYATTNAVIQRAQAIQDLGVILHAAGRLDEAAELYAQALDSLETILSEDHPGLFALRTNLASLSLDRGELDEARRLFVKLLEMQRRRLGPEHPDVAHTMFYLGLVEDAAGEWHDGIALMREALRIQRRALPDDHITIAITASLIGDILAQEGRPEEGEPFIRESLEMRRRALGDQHWQTAISAGMLGDCYTAIGRYPKAEPLLLESLETVSAALGETHEQTGLALRRLVHLYEAWGRPDQAAVYRTRLSERLLADDTGA